jgi:hypothetical protein
LRGDVAAKRLVMQEWDSKMCECDVSSGYVCEDCHINKIAERLTRLRRGTPQAQRAQRMMGPTSELSEAERAAWLARRRSAMNAAAQQVVDLIHRVAGGRTKRALLGTAESEYWVQYALGDIGAEPDFRGVPAPSAYVEAIKRRED